MILDSNTITVEVVKTGEAWHSRYLKAFYLYWPRARRSFKPEKLADKLRGVGNSSSDETGSDFMKYWEIIADKLSAAGWSWGYRSAVMSYGRR